MQGSNHDDVRRHNLSVIMRLLHRSGPTSRAQLTRLTGLNRSTIAALVAELAGLGLAQEREPDATNQVGRPSPVVAVSDRVVALAVNPEIDAVTVAIVGLDGRVHRVIRHATDASPSVAEAVSIAAGAIASLREELAGHRVVGVGAAIPGLVRAKDGLVRHAPHLGWVDAPFAEMLEQACGYPVFAANDASLGAIAERYFGAGRGMTDLIYLNGGASGIGGGMIVGGNVVGGLAGYAGEFGHARVSGSSRTDSAGFAGTLEAEVTRAGLLAALGLSGASDDELAAALVAALVAAASASASSSSASSASSASSTSSAEVSAPASGSPSSSPSASAAAPSSAVRDEVNRQLDFLAVALAGAINILNPQMVVLGGFLAALLAVDADRLQAAVAAHTLGAPFEAVQIRAAELGPNLLMIGAAELAFERLLDDPQATRVPAP